MDYLNEVRKYRFKLMVHAHVLRSPGWVVFFMKQQKNWEKLLISKN